MKCEVIPSEISDVKPFSTSSYLSYRSEDAANTFGHISKNGLWMWVVHDTTINIYSAESKEWCGGHCFGESLKNPSAKITTVTEFLSSHISFSCLLVTVNQDHESVLCMFNATTCKVVRAVLVPDRVTSVDVVSGNGGACMETHHLNPCLRYMFGIVAVGTVNGRIYFLDLNLDENFHCDEKSPNITTVLRKRECSAVRREAAISKKQHVFMHLNDKCTRDGYFEFQSRSSTLGRFPNVEVFVTALKYVNSLGTLAVGFSFGGIQLWDLRELSLQFTIATDLHEQPIVAFAFQEPENDPRNFCYLWIISGHVKGEYRPETISVATLYSLTYNKREEINSFGSLYSELQSCNKRFEYPLTSDPFSPSQPNMSYGTCLASCQVICQTEVSHTLDAVSGNESDCLSEDMSLCFLSWEVWSDSATSPSSYHLAVFDLNQWYQAQMPFSFRCSPTDLSPYFGIFSLEEVARNFNRNLILGLYVIPQSVKKFKYLAASEEFFYPSSLGFQVLLFSDSGLVRATYFGFQRHLLFKMAELGPQAILNPKDIFSALLVSGLVADTHSGAERTPLIVQKEALLQLALEYHLPFFFMRCLKEWQNADSIHECCSSRALLNWAWKKVISIKSSIDRLSLPLFNCAGSDIDKASLRYLCSFRRQLSLIDSIIAGYQKYATPRTDLGIQELQCRKDVVHSINLYLQALLWLRAVHILPEVCEGEQTDKNIFYPVTALMDSYSARRKQLQKIHAFIGPTDIMLIDGLVKEAVISNTWQEKGGTGTYPPPSVYAALSCYLLDGVGIELKHALMYYLLMDISHYSPNFQNPLVSEIKTFPIIFEMTESMVKLIEGFWYLDRRDFEGALKNLLDSAVVVTDILPWQHQRIIKSFLYSREPQKALKYINHIEPPEVTMEDIKLHMSVLLSCGAITQAFDYQRRKQKEGYNGELLNHLFRGCQEMRKMKDLMYLPLNVLESSSLERFLTENGDPRAQEALVMYYLLHCNFFEAAKLNEKISRSLMNKTTSTYERAADRDALVEGFMAAVPQTEKNLVEEIKHRPPETLHKDDVMQPLSISVKCASLREVTDSDILNSLIYRASSLMSHLYMDSQTPVKPRSKSYFEDMPFLRPPIAPERVRQTSEIMSSTPLSKRSLSSPNLNEYSSPAKKSRLLDNAPFRTTPPIRRQTPKHLAGDVASLLQTPPIHRRMSKTTKDTVRPTAPGITPQSILKKTVRPSKLLESDFYRAPTPPLPTEEINSCSEPVQAENQLPCKESVEVEVSRQIRFEVPVEEQNINEHAEHAESNMSEEASKPVPLLEPATTEMSDISEDIATDNHTMPSLESFTVNSKESWNSSSRSFCLTREPLKGHAEKTLDQKPKQFDLPIDRTNIAKETKYDDISMQSSQLSQTTDVKATEKTDGVEVLQVSEFSNKISTYTEETVQSEFSALLPPTKSSDILPCEEGEPPLEPHHSAISMSDQSAESLDCSFYSVPSERSFTVSPRRPLRDTGSAFQEQSVPTPSANILPLSNMTTTSDKGTLDHALLKEESVISELNTSSQKFVERFDFLSENSDIYENTSLIQETEKLLKENEKLIQDVKPSAIEGENTKLTSKKPFVFTSTKSQKDSNIKKKTRSKTSKSALQVSESQTNDHVKFLQGGGAETYEEFSSSLQKSVVTDDVENKDTKPFLSSPCNATPMDEHFSEDVKTNFSSEITSGSVKEAKTKKKVFSFTKKDSVGQHEIGMEKTQKSSNRKKGKGASQKIEFAFAEPHSPAGPEILEALASTPEYPVPSFMFSPPLTRGRLRQKRLDETMGSSFCSVLSESSFSQTKKPPVDSILEEIIRERAPESKKVASKVLSTSHSRSVTKKKKSVKNSRVIPCQGKVSDKSLNLSLVNESEKLPLNSSTSSASKLSGKHNMVLRQVKQKPSDFI